MGRVHDYYKLTSLSVWLTLKMLCLFGWMRCSKLETTRVECRFMRFRRRGTRYQVFSRQKEGFPFRWVLDFFISARNAETLDVLQQSPVRHTGGGGHLVGSEFVAFKPVGSCT